MMDLLDTSWAITGPLVYVLIENISRILPSLSMG
jgi:hypothetical protein